ncbi:MAG: hypothetical protein JSS63_15400 [Bacteroidetes bacterium]|nr:hypothetical protein [Bacteroidota bacterium]
MSDSINILFLWKPDTVLVNYIKSGVKNLKNIEFHFINKNASKENEAKLYSKANIIIGWRPDEELIKNAKYLKLFINPGAGVKHLIKLFTELNEKKKITLVNGHGNSYFVAQHTVALLLVLVNKIILHDKWMRQGKWRLGDSEAASIPLREKKIGLLGYGAINKKVHKFLSGFDVEFHILKRSWSKSEKSSAVVKYSSEQLHKFLKKIDVLIIALPDTKETNNLIDVKELKLLGKEGIIVNVARGPVVNEKSLFNSLKKKIITGAAIDVWYNYNPTEKKKKKYPFNFPFDELDNVVLSPHRAASPFSDLKRWDEVVENIAKFAKEKKNFLNVVDLKKGY